MRNFFKYNIRLLRIRHIALLEKFSEHLNFNGYLLMGWSESHISLNCQRHMAFTLPHQQIFIEFSIFADIFLTLCNCTQMSSLLG